MDDTTQQAAGPAVADQDVIDFLQAADKTIHTYGWIQHSFGSTYRGFCADGALAHVLSEQSYSLPVYFTARRMLEFAIDNHIIGPWNDVYGRTEPQVHTAYRRAIHYVRNGALA